MSKVYLASSWKNKDLLAAIATLLKDSGFEVFNFSDPTNTGTSFTWEQIVGYSTMTAIDALQVPIVIEAFKEDKKWLDWADWVLLVLPSGKSSHLEAGYAAGAGKKLAIFSQFLIPGELETMYGFTDIIGTNIHEVIQLMQQKDTQKEPVLSGAEVLNLWIDHKRSKGMTDAEIANHAFAYKGTVLELSKPRQQGKFDLVSRLGAIDLYQWYLTEGKNL